MAGIEGDVLANELEAIYISKALNDSKKKSEVLEAYYLAKHAYETVYSSE